MNNYAYLNARVSIFAGRLLSEKDLTNPSDDLLNNPAVEQACLIRMLADFKVLVRPLSGIARDLLMYWFQKNDIANLKTIVRGKIAGLEANAISAQLLELGTLSALPIKQLLHTEDIGELLRHLENSHYGNIARQARRVFEKEHQLYSLDAAIDRHYLLGFVQKVRALDTKQRQYLSPLVGILMDRFNLLWLLRYRFAYNLSSAETYYLLVPTPYLLNRTRLQHLVELNTLQEVLEYLPKPLYNLLIDADTAFAVDKRLTMETRRVALMILKLQNFTLAKAFAYVLLREMEMRRAMAIIKGKRLNLNKDIISSAAEALMA